jgi:hypothetical protein
MKTRYSPKNTFTIVNNQNIFDIAKERINAETNSATVLIPHVCNNVNGFGAGFAGQIASLYPEVKANFHLLGNQAKLGHVQFVTADSESRNKNKIIFANMISQNGIISRSNNRPLNYGALVYCMNQVRAFAKEYNRTNEIDNFEIHAPKFGSGLAGGNWSFISYLIDDIWSDLNVFIYNYIKK